MEFQEFVPSAPYVASVVVVGLLLWRVFVRLLSGMEARFNDRFAHMEKRFDDRFVHMEKRFGDRFVHMEKRFGDRFAQIDDRFVQIDDRFDSLEKKLDGLADDHHNLSRELSEFRGEMRGRLSMLVPEAAGET